MMIILWLSIKNEREGSIVYLKANPLLSVMIILVGSVAAFSYNLVNYYYTMVASAVITMVSTQLAKILLMTASAIVDQITAWYNWTGLGIFYIAVLAFAYLQIQSIRDKQAAQTKPAAEESKKTEGDQKSG